MKNATPCLYTLIAIVLLVSCVRKNNNHSGDHELTGDWFFTGMHLKTVNTVTYSDGTDVLKTVTFSDAETTDNGGSLHISADTLTGEGFTYTLKTTARAYIYENNKLTDSVRSPFQFTLPPASSVVKYKRAGTDSIYFNPCLITGVGKGMTPECVTGARIEFDKNRLMVSSSVTETSTQKKKGIRYAIANKSTAIITFERQARK